MLQSSWIWPRDSVPARYNSRGAANPRRVTTVTWREFIVLQETWPDTETVPRMGGHIRELYSSRCQLRQYIDIGKPEFISGIYFENYKAQFWLLSLLSSTVLTCIFCTDIHKTLENDPNKLDNIFTHQFKCLKENGGYRDCFMFVEMLWRKDENIQLEIQRVYRYWRIG